MTASNRIEYDSPGEVFVPSNALYGAQTQRAIENFPISGLKPRQAFIWSMGMIKRAAAEVNMELGLLDTKKTNAALNPLIGYSQGAELAKEAAARNMTIHEVAVEKAKDGRLKNVNGDRLVTIEEIESALGDLRRLT